MTYLDAFTLSVALTNFNIEIAKLYFPQKLKF